jgi:hypothetical protein
MDITQAERNALGTMLIERIAQKKKIQLRWAYLDGASLSTLLTAVDPIYFNVTYLDPKTNSYKTGSFYCGDRSTGMIDFRNGVPRYKDIQFDLIER